MLVIIALSIATESSSEPRLTDSNAKAIVATRNAVDSFSVTFKSPTINPSTARTATTEKSAAATAPAITAITMLARKTHFPAVSIVIFYPLQYNALLRNKPHFPLLLRSHRVYSLEGDHDCGRCHEGANEAQYVADDLSHGAYRLEVCRAGRQQCYCGHEGRYGLLFGDVYQSHQHAKDHHDGRYASIAGFRADEGRQSGHYSYKYEKHECDLTQSLHIHYEPLLPTPNGILLLD